MVALQRQRVDSGVLTMTLRRKNRRAFTLIEVMISLVMLASVALCLTTATAPLIRMAATTRVRTQANEVANALIAQVRTWPEYSTLDATFAGTVANWPMPGWSRTTIVVRTGGQGQANDFKRVTVTVVAPSLTAPIQRTITVAAP